MKFKVKSCKTVGNAYCVVSVSKFGREKTIAIGLTHFEAICLCKRLN